MATTCPEDNPTALKKACAPTKAQVVCSIILSPSAGSPDLAAYLDRLTRQNIRCDYEVIVGGRATDIEPSMPEASLPRVRLVEVHADLEQEPAFDACAATAQGKYLLFVRELVDFDAAMLEESIKELENSGNKLSISGTAKFVLVERSFYREAGLLDRLLEPVDFLDKGCGIPGETSSSETRSDPQPNERGDAIRDEYSNLLDLGQFFRDVDDYVILKLPESFPNYRDHSDIDILCRDRDHVLKHILNVGKAYQDKGFRIEAAECARNLHVDFFAPGACRLNFRFDLLDGLTYEKFEIGSGYTDVVLKSRQRISRNGVTIYVPALEHDLAIRFLEYVEHQDKRPDKIKHWEYIKSHYHPGLVNIINSHTDLKLTVQQTENGVNLAVSRKNADQGVIEAVARPAQHKFYHLSETCQIPELGEIYERYFGRRTDGCFVEVGAFDGEFVSNTSGLADIGWIGHYIEPVPEYAQRCRVRHAKNPKVTVSQIAIGPEPAAVKINVAGALSTISERAKRNFQSLDWAKGHFRQERKVAVRQLTLDQYLEQRAVQPGLELLVVDVEGYEWEVFRNFDIQKWRPQMVVVELHDQNDDYLALREDCKKLVHYFAHYNYKVIYKDASNTIFISNALPVAKTRIDYFLIWGHGLQYTRQILDIIRGVEDFKIINIVKKHVADIERFVRDIYACDTVPFQHLASKTRYLLKTKPEIVFILVRNKNPQEKYFGEGPFRHIQCKLVKDVKEEIRNRFNPRQDGKRSEQHVIHASDYESQVRHVLKVIGLPPMEYYTRQPNRDLDVPFHIEPFDTYAVTEVQADDLRANILGAGLVPITQTPHYRYLTGDKQAYKLYHERHFGSRLTEDHFPEAYDRMIAAFRYDHVTPDGKRSLILAQSLSDGTYRILDGVHRAAILKHRGAKTVVIAQPVRLAKAISDKVCVVGLVFSKDRAMQLRATLESFILHCGDADRLNLYVLYTTSNARHRQQYEKLKETLPRVTFVEQKDFRAQTLSILGGYRHVLFLVDDNIFVKPFRINDVTRALDKETDALGFSLRLGTNTDYCYPRDVAQTVPSFEEIGVDILKYRWTNAQYDFGYPLEVSSSVFRTADIVPLLRGIEFDTPNRLEALLDKNKSRCCALPALLTFRESVTFCNPVNVVQHTYRNKHGVMHPYTCEELAEKFEQGLAIDVERYIGFVPRAAHHELELHFSQLPLHNLTQQQVQDESKPLVTVYTVTYNTERYIRHAIESVLAQDYPNIEYLIIDDGSTDNTRAIISSCKDPRITYVYMEHKNLASRMNEAIRRAQGTFVLGVDADDYIDPCYVRYMVDFAMKHPDHDYYYPQIMTHLNENNQLWPSSYRYRDYADSREILRLVFQNGYGVVPNPGSLKRRSLYDKTGLYRELANVEDFAYLAEHALRIRYKLVPDNPPYYYRRVEGHGNTRKYDSRHRIMAESMYDMVMANDPLVLYPDLQRIADSTERKTEFLRLAAETMERHAEHHRERCGFHFKEYADKIRERLKDMNVSQHRISVGAVSSVPNRKLKIAVLSDANGLSFMGQILARIRSRHDVRILDCSDGNAISRALMSADVCWIEWATDFAAWLTKLPRRCKTILRLHSFEAFRSFPRQIQWENVDDLVFVSPHIREVLKHQVPDIEAKVRTHVVPNCVDLDQFYFKDKPRGKRIAFVGALRPAKNIPFLMQCFREIYSADPEYTLHMAGELFGDELHQNELHYYIRHMVKELEIRDHVFFYGRVQDVSPWLDDKDFILVTSIREGHPVNVIEGMAKGLKPVIHNFPGAKYFYLHKWIFNSAPECRNIILSPDFDRQEYVTYVKEHWSAEKVLPQIDALLESIVANRCEAEGAATVQTGTTSSHLDRPMPMSNPKVSIVTACYNAQEFLSECLDSILEQTMQEWELFLLDDGSTDATRNIIEQYSRMDERIKPYHFQSSEGPYARRNFAIKRASADFIVIQDADDIMSPVKLQILYDKMRKDDRLAVVGSFYRLFLDEFKGLQYTDPCEFPLEHDEITAKFSSWRHTMSHGSAIIRKTLFEQIGYYDENAFASDKFWFAKLAEYARHCTDVKFKNVPEYLTLIRVHADCQTQLLPVIDPRNRRMRYCQYGELKLRKIRRRLETWPNTDIGTELKNCVCSDFLERFKDHIVRWEGEVLDETVLLDLLNVSVRSFNKSSYVSCIGLLNAIERMAPKIAARFRNYDLLRAMAFFALDMKKHSLMYLNREVQNHRNTAAKQFICDYFEKHLERDVQKWCAENTDLYDLQMIDTRAVAQTAQ